MRFFLIVICWITMAVIPHQSIAQQQNKNNTGWEKEVDEFILQEMGDWNIPGLALAVVENNEILLLKGYGVTNIQTKEPVHPDSTVFHVASISKPITATAVLQLYDRNQLNLNQEINEFLNKPTFKNAFEHYPTPAQLLVHTGGFDIKNINRYSRSSEKLQPIEDYLVNNIPPIIYPPGSISIYSNHGYTLLGHIVSVASEQPFSSYMEEHLFKPLEMANSSFDSHSSITQKLATGYGFGPNKDNQAEPVYIKTIPASMLKTTAADISHWMLAVLNQGSYKGIQILKPATNRTLLTRQYSNHPLLAGRSNGLSESSRFSPPEFLHSGAVPGFTSALVLVPEENFGLFITANSNAYLWGIVNHILDCVDSKPGSREPITQKVNFDSSSEFQGYYRAAGIPQNSMFKFGNWIQQTYIASLSDGQIEWDGNSYQPVDSLAFQQNEGNSIIAFKKVGEDISYLFAGGDEYIKISWFQNIFLQGVILIIFVITFLTIGIRWGAIPLFKKGSSDAGHQWPIVIASVAVVINFLFLASIIYLAIVELGDQNVLIYGIPLWIKLISGLVWISFILTIGTIIGSILSWKEDYWKWKKRLIYSIVSTILLLFIPYAFYWNLMG